eukprot:TRINITY_DN2278_c0_g1_i1.p1 TRINITY_DN2278_c0_g1~~TRINITY_DN2278_c0_g1_i1.p1  ORF type:complete len:104 (-),score=15.39 TRINITY_DN2278_c0_g1_i1:131-421(-)
MTSLQIARGGLHDKRSYEWIPGLGYLELSSETNTTNVGKKTHDSIAPTQKRRQGTGNGSSAVQLPSFGSEAADEVSAPLSVAPVPDEFAVPSFLSP